MVGVWSGVPGLQYDVMCVQCHSFVNVCIQSTFCILTGRNELIARYIKLRTGKQRTRKQVHTYSGWGEMQCVGAVVVSDSDHTGMAPLYRDDADTTVPLATSPPPPPPQVSSHIQVLARKKSREFQGKIKVCAQ